MITLKLSDIATASWELAEERGLRALEWQEDYSLAEIYGRCLGNDANTSRAIGFQSGCS